MRLGRALMLLLPFLSACPSSHGAGDAGRDGAAAPTDAGPAPRILPSGWRVYTVAESAEGYSFGLGRLPELVIDDEGTFHISHSHQKDGSALYSYGAPGSWHTETIVEGATERNIGRVGLALVDGTVHVVFDQRGGPGPTWGRRSSDGTWGLDPLPFVSGPFESDQPALAADRSGAALDAAGIESTTATGELRISHVGLTDGAEPATTIPDVRVTDIPALDLRALRTSDGHLHVAMTDLTDTQLATMSPSGRWTVRAIESPALDLAERPDGRFEIVMATETSSADGDRDVVWSLRSSDGGAVRREPLPVPAGFWQRVRLAIDQATGTTHAALETPGTVHYAVRREGVWNREKVQDVSSGHGRPTVAVDPEGTPWLAYRTIYGDLVVARPPPR